MGSGGRSQTFDSNGPNVKVRGTAAQVLEKYLALARDATSSGDRITAENYSQHAEHYFRVMTANGANSERVPDRGGPDRGGGQGRHGGNGAQPEISTLHETGHEPGKDKPQQVAPAEPKPEAGDKKAAEAPKTGESEDAAAPPPTSDEPATP